MIRNNEKLKYLIIGLLNTFFGYSIFIFFDLFFSNFLFERSYFYANLIARPISILIAFVFHSVITFKKKLLNISRFLKFSSSYFLTYILSLLLLPTLVEIFKIHPWLSNFGLIILFGVVNFFNHKYWTFK